MSIGGKAVAYTDRNHTFLFGCTGTPPAAQNTVVIAVSCVHAGVGDTIVLAAGVVHELPVPVSSKTAIAGATYSVAELRYGGKLGAPLIITSAPGYICI